MADDLAKLDAHIAKLLRLPDLARVAAPSVARAVEIDLKRQISAGTSPDGQAWQPKQDGTRPLTNAAASLTVVAVGTTVFARLKGPVARHHLGRAKGSIERQILPKQEIPASMAAGIKAALITHFQAAVSDG